LRTLNLIGSRDHFPDYLPKGGGCTLPDQPGPLVPLSGPVPAFRSGKGENHLAGLSGFCHDRDDKGEITDCIFPGLYLLDSCKRDLFGRQDVLCPVDKDDTPAGKNTFKRDRLDVDPLCPHENFFVTTDFWIGHDTTARYLFGSGCLLHGKKIFILLCPHSPMATYPDYTGIIIGRWLAVQEKREDCISSLDENDRVR